MKSLGRKQGSRLRLCFRFVDDVAERKGVDLCKQMFSSKCSFTCICGIFLLLHPSTTTVYARSAFYPSLRFTLSLQSAFYTQSAFYPWLRSLQFAVQVLSLRFTLTGLYQYTCMLENRVSKNINSFYYLGSTLMVPRTFQRVHI